MYIAAILALIGLSAASPHPYPSDSTVLSPAELGRCQINATPNVTDLGGIDYAANVQSAKLVNDRTYRFVRYEPNGQKPYLLFLHGFPSTSFDWRRQFRFLHDKGYGIIAPDLLGYGGTDKPTDLQAYRLKPMVEEIIGLLDCVGVENVVTISHDWGSLLHSRIITYRPDRLLATVFLDIAYFAAPLALSSTTATIINSVTRLSLGYPIFGYWFFFSSPDAAAIMDAHPRSASSLIYANDQKMQSSNFCDPAALRSWLLANKTAPAAPWLPESELQTFERIIADNGGYAGGLQWYKAITGSINADDEAAARAKSAQIKVPTLLITAEKDPIGLPFFARTMITPYATNLTEKSVGAGHFVHVEQDAVVNRHLGEFLDGLRQ